MKFTIYKESRIGGRQANQDRLGYADTPAAILMVLADGMGGHARGDIAAQILVDVVVDRFRKEARPDIESVTTFMLDSIHFAHETINEYAVKFQMPEAPRTTCVVCLIQRNRAYWAHAGDSRLYHFSRDRLISRTRDHSAVQALLDGGYITEAEANSHPERNLLLNGLGGDVVPKVDLSSGVVLQEGDVLLMGSDGFWSEFSDDEMLATLRVYPIGQALAQLLDHAEYRAGGQGDNLTVIGLRCGEDIQPTRDLGDLGLDGFTTELNDLSGKSGESPPPLSDDDIDQAIEDIQNALNKYKLDK